MRQFIRSSKAVHLFRQFEPELPRRFGDPLALVELLADRAVDPADRDDLFRVVLTHAQGGSRAAIAVLWLALWGGLDRIYGRHFQRYDWKPDELVSDLSASFMAAVHSARLDHIERLASTLIMNTERRMEAGLDRRRRRLEREEELPADNSSEALQVPATAASMLGLTPGSTEDEAVKRVHGWLARRIPKDAELIVATVVLGETQKSFADRQGLTHEAIRKRHQRALESLRGLSHFAEGQRLSRVRGKKPPPRRARR